MLLFSLLKRFFLMAFSYVDFSIKKNYRLVRRLVSVTSRTLFPFRYKKLDVEIELGDRTVPVRIFSPNHEKVLPVIIFFHGGGWVTGDINSYIQPCANLAKYTSHRVVSVDYRLAPEHKFPCGVEDCYAVTRELLKHSYLLNVQPEDITLMGDSAGANLAAAVSLMMRDREEIGVERQVLIYPATYDDHHVDTSPFDSIREKSIGYILTVGQVCDYIDLYKRDDNDLQNPYFAPLHARDFSRQPETLVITAEHDPLRDEGKAYARKLKEAGNRVEYHCIAGAMHGFFSSPPRAEPKLRECYQLINGFLNGI